MKKIMLLVAMVALLLVSASVAYGATEIQATDAHDYKVDPTDNFEDPPCGDPIPCKEQLFGTNGADFLDPSPGWDWVNSKDGADVLKGGPGMDVLYSQNQNDTIYGQEGHDHIYCGDGSDLCSTADGEDENNHIEEAWGDQPGKGESGYDECTIDADPDGAVVRSCEKLRILAVSGFSGQTEIWPDKQAKESGSRGDFYAVGTYTSVN